MALHSPLARFVDPYVHVPEKLRNEYDTKVMEHAEHVKPFVDEWQSRVDVEVERRVAEYCKSAGLSRLPPNHYRRDAIRRKVETDSDFKYTGPERDYDRYRWFEEKKLRSDEHAEREAKMTEGLPKGYKRYPDNLIRGRRKDGADGIVAPENVPGYQPKPTE